MVPKATYGQGHMNLQFWHLKDIHAWQWPDFFEHQHVRGTLKQRTTFR
jgi:hypothetical protein